MMLKNVFYIFALAISFQNCAYKNYLHSSNVKSYTIDSQPNSAVLDSIIAPYRVKIEKQMNETIAVLDVDLKKEQPESTMGNLVADLMIDYCKDAKIEADFAVVNYNGLRIPNIAKGNLARGKVFELMPFDNQIVILELDSILIQKMCDAMAQKGGWHISKGLGYEIKNAKSQNIKIFGTPLNNKTTYKVMMSDYIANGGDNCSFLSTVKQNVTNILIRDLLLIQIEAKTKKGEHLTSQLDKRCLLIK